METEEQKAAAPAAAKATAKVQFEQVVVAPRRTVHYEGRAYGPGSMVKLPKDEVQYLRRTGFLLVPDAEQDAADGPTVNGDGLGVVRPQ